MLKLALLVADDVTYPTLTDETPKFSRATKPSQESSVTSTGLTDGKNLTPNEFVEDSNIIQSKDIASTVDIPISSQVPNIIKATPSVDRSSKVSIRRPNKTNLEQSMLIFCTQTSCFVRLILIM